MKRSEFNTKLRNFTREKLSPSEAEKDLIKDLYYELSRVFAGKCIQVGSYARFTAITPIHDLDIFYLAGNYDEKHIDPAVVLDELGVLIRTDFVNPTTLQYNISLQSHSITVQFAQGGEDSFSIDIVPAYNAGLQNEFGDDIYWIPELGEISHSSRKVYYAEKKEDNRAVAWIKTDPKGYIFLARRINSNTDFRKTVKFLKAWNLGLKKLDKGFKFKSFHIEQIVAGYFDQDENLDFFGAVFQFFCEMQNILAKPQLRDRADSNKFIDAYIADFTNDQRKMFLQARDHFMRQLEAFESSDDVATLLDVQFYRRKSDHEQFVFDFGIPTFIDRACRIKIDGRVLAREGFREFWLSENSNRVLVGNKVRFSIRDNTTQAGWFKWKVKNSDDSENPRGEITDNGTKANPETTEYRGNHYVECYAIENSICVARCRQDVIIY